MKTKHNFFEEKNVSDPRSDRVPQELHVYKNLQWPVVSRVGNTALTCLKGTVLFAL